MSIRDEIGGRARAVRGPGAFRVGTVLVIVALSVLGFMAAIVLGGWADELREDDRSGEHVLSNSAVGFGGLLAILQDVGVETSVSRSDRILDPQAVRVFTFARPPSESVLQDIAEYRWQLDEGGPILFVLPKWRTREAVDPQEKGRGWVRRSPINDLYSRYGLGQAFEIWGEPFRIDRASGIKTYDTGDVMAEQINERLDSGSTRGVKVEALQTLAPGWTDVSSGRRSRSPEDDRIMDELYGPDPDDLYGEGGEGSADEAAQDDDASEIEETRASNASTLRIGVDLALDGQPVFFSVHGEDDELLYHVLTDPDLLNTQGLDTLSRAKLGLGIIDHMRSVNSAGASGEASAPVSFDLTLHGFARSSNLIKTLTRPPLLGAMLCVLAAALLGGWMAFGRFGDPERRAESAYAGTGKRALIDNGARLIGLARRTLGLADDYAALQRRRTVRRLRLSGEREARVDAALEGLSRTVGRDVPAALHAIETSSDAAGLVRAARTYHDMTEDITTTG